MTFVIRIGRKHPGIPCVYISPVAQEQREPDQADNIELDGVFDAVLQIISANPLGFRLEERHANSCSDPDDAPRRASSMELVITPMVEIRGRTDSDVSPEEGLMGHGSRPKNR